MSYPVRPKRTIRDVSHHFLSQVPSISPVEHKPIIGCYLAKGVVHEDQAVRLILENHVTEEQSVQFCHLCRSSAATTLSKTFQSVPFSQDQFQNEFLRKGSGAVASAETTASAYCFVFREDDCLALDPLVSVLGAVILVGSATGKDMAEMYKVVKGFRKAISIKQWFLRFYPELTSSTSRLVVQQFNKVTLRFLSVEIMGLYANDPESVQIWRDANRRLDEETISRQNAFAAFIDQQVNINGNFSQSHRP